MTAPSRDSPDDAVPRTRSLSQLREAARLCQACPLWRTGTQTVFGEGPRKAEVMLVGEQPGHEEDLAGKPFVGPAGRLLDQALEAAGLDRDVIYVSNVVKHFKWTPRGKRRLHQKPNALEIRACLPWLEAEVGLVKPKIVVCLGATAAQAVLGRNFRVTAQRGQMLASKLSPQTIATIHPSSILRAPTSEDRARELKRFVHDLALVAVALGTSKR